MFFQDHFHKFFFVIFFALLSQCSFAKSENEIGFQNAVSSDTMLKLNVTVLDETGYPAPFAKVILFRYGVQYGVGMTDFDGHAIFPRLTPSVYQINIVFPGYATIDTSLFLIDPVESISFKMQPFPIDTIRIDIITYAIPTINASAGPSGGIITRLDSNYYNLNSQTPPNGIYLGVYTVVGASTIPEKVSGYFPKVSYLQPTYSAVMISAVPMSYNYLIGSAPLESGIPHGSYCSGFHDEPWDFLMLEEHPELDLFLIDKYGMKGVMNSDSVMVIEPVYNSIREMHGIYYDRFIVQKGNYFGVLDGENKWVLPLEFDEIYSCSKRLSCVHARNLLVVKKDGKYGLYTSNGDTIVFPKYDYLDSRLDEFACPAEKRAMVVSLNGKFGFIDETGKEILPLIYDSIAISKQDWRAIIYKDGKKGLVNFEGEILLEAIYDDLKFEFPASEIIVVQNGKHGMIDFYSGIIIPIIYDEVIDAGTLYVIDKIDSLDQYYQARRVCFVRSGKMWGIINDFDTSVKVNCVFQELKMMEVDMTDFIQFRDGAKWGVVNQYGEILQPAKFDEIRSIGDFQYMYRIGSKWGFIFDSGKQISPAIYDEVIVYEYNNGFFNVKKGNLYGVCRADGVEIIKPKLLSQVDTDDLTTYGFSNFEVNSKFGLVDSTGKIICQAIYDEPIYVHNFYSGYNDYTLAIRNGKQVAINNKGVEVIGPYYDDFYTSDVTGNYFIVEKELKFGVVSLSGKKMITPKYERIYSLIEIRNGETENYLFKVGLGGKMGLIDTLGNTVLPFVFDEIYWDGYSKFRVKKDGKENLYDVLGNCLIPVWYQSINSFNGTCAVVLGSNSKFGLVNIAGDTLAPFKYSHMSYVPNSNYYLVYQNSLEGLLDSSGKERIPPIYHNVKYYSEDFIAVKKNDLYGFINENDSLVVDYKYEKVKEVWGNYVSVRDNNKFGVVDKKGNEILPCILDLEIDFISLMRNGYLSVSSYYKYGLIDSSFNFILEPNYENKIFFEAGQKYIIVKRNMLYGVIDTSMREVIPCLYPSISQRFFTQTQLFEVNVDGKFGMINMSNMIVLSVEYDYISLFMFSGEGEGKFCFVVKIGDKFALMTLDGKPITEFIYTGWGKDESGKSYLYRDDRTFMILQDGTEIPFLR